MGRKNKRILALFLALVMVVASIHIGELQSKADDNSIAALDGESSLDLSGVTTDINIVNNGDNNAINATVATQYTIDGVNYNNYMRYEGISSEASSEKDAASHAVDGKTNTRWETVQGDEADPSYLTVDFGNIYSLKDIIIYWEGASAKEYTLEVSQDGSNFQKLTDVTSKNGKRTDEIKLSKEISVRSIRIYGTSRTTVYGYSIYEIGCFGSSPQGKVVPILSNLQIRDYSQYTGKYLVYFNEPEESFGYNIYIDNKDNPVKTVKKSGSYLTAGELANYTVGTHTMYVSNIGDDGRESAMVSRKFEITGESGTNNDISQVYIYTTQAINGNYHENADVSVSIVDKEGGTYKDVIDSKSNIKVRGNTTAGAPKKPWNIKLSSKESVLGMDKGKKWCLLANSFDKSLMRNKIAYDLGLEIGVNYTSQNRFVEVYLNGKFQGNYLMTEPVEAKSGRVEIDAYGADNNDILLELGTRNEEGVDHFTTSVLRTTFDVNDPEKGDDLTDVQVDDKIARVKDFLDNFERALQGQKYDEILKYMDEDTFVNFYIVNELMKNVDFNFSSTRFYIQGDKIYAGPCWDFDLSSGNCKSAMYTNYYVDGVSYKGYYCQSMNWYRQLFKNQEFYNKVKERYKELQYKIQNMYKTDSETELSISNFVNIYGNSFMRNYQSANELGAGWSFTNEDGYSYTAEAGWTTWQQPIEFLRDWLKNRNIWLCEQWGVDMDSAYEASKPIVPIETETPTEKTTEPETVENTIAAFQYIGTADDIGNDLTAYADPDDSYSYHATAGSGTMAASVTGTNPKHMEWGDAADYGYVVPVLSASKSNLWSPDAYVAYIFSTKGKSEVKASVDVGGTKKGPANLNIGYYAGKEFQSITTYTIAKNKTMYTVQFDLPKNLENQDSVTIYVKLADTINIGGNEMTDAAYNTGGELAINNFIVTGKSETPETESQTKPETMPETESPTVKPTTSEETVEPPKGLAYAGNEGSTYFFAWGASEDVAYYNIYINGVKTTSTIFNMYKLDVSDVTADGTYTIGITSVDAKGNESEMVTTVCTIEKQDTTSEKITTVSNDNGTTTAEQNKTTALATTTEQNKTSVSVTAKATVKAPSRGKVKKATKKRTSKKAKISLKKISGAKGYRIQISTTKKFKKILVKKTVKKVKFNISSVKIKNRKKLYVRVKAYRLDGKTKVFGKWSKAKKIKMK